MPTSCLGFQETYNMCAFNWGSWPLSLSLWFWLHTYFFEIVSPYVAQVDLKLSIPCLNLMSSGIPGVHHHTGLMWHFDLLLILLEKNMM
jgi:hypothetical protein